MAEDGIDDFAAAKRKAARALGASDRESLPTNEEIESELRTYLSLYQREEHEERLRELREIALDAMAAFERFRPYLSGAVLKGTAGRYADIDLHVFTDDPKAVEIHLLNEGIAYETDEQRFFAGDEPRSVPVLTVDWSGVPVNIAVFESRDERRTMRASVGGRPLERAALAAVAALTDPDAA